MVHAKFDVLRIQIVRGQFFICKPNYFATFTITTDSHSSGLRLQQRMKVDDNLKLFNNYRPEFYF